MSCDVGSEMWAHIPGEQHTVFIQSHNFLQSSFYFDSNFKNSFENWIGIARNSYLDLTIYTVLSVDSGHRVTEDYFLRGNLFHNY
jgi:hypothetical protein